MLTTRVKTTRASERRSILRSGVEGSSFNLLRLALANVSTHFNGMSKIDEGLTMGFLQLGC